MDLFRQTAAPLTAAGEPSGHPGERELAELMVRYQLGDAAAVEELVQRLSPRLMRFFAATEPPGEREDLFQDCWIRVHRSRHTYRAGEPLLPWIFAIARHTRLDAYRRRRRRESRELAVDVLPEVASAVPEQSGGENFDRLLEKLPEGQREVIVMLKVTGMSLEDVARATSSTVGAVKQKAHRAYSTLRSVLEKEGHA